MKWNLDAIRATYHGSDGDRTKWLYSMLQQVGPAGMVSMNLFRAAKCSARAKVYRGGNSQGSYKAMAYERKQWSIDQLAAILAQHGQALGIVWGWGTDPKQPVHAAIRYVELPTGQVSFHTAPRGKGPDFPGKWDGVRGEAPERICKFCAQTLRQSVAA